MKLWVIASCVREWGRGQDQIAHPFPEKPRETRLTFVQTIFWIFSPTTLCSIKCEHCCLGSESAQHTRGGERGGGGCCGKKNKSEDTLQTVTHSIINSKPETNISSNAPSINTHPNKLTGHFRASTRGRSARKCCGGEINSE
ncbi:hypothetical protein CDAR_264581 [Caerostris darwini]|uniref:Uncharacterized protein n=1 Tax=Caerostris darwini TaxID=1538125 RepID=A0AAV4NLJ0_9ARAC|nr:hypothetical protein CDAR_264581 [Caerostris darwini]